MPQRYVFFLKLWRTEFHFVRPLEPLFLTFDDVCPLVSKPGQVPHWHTFRWCAVDFSDSLADLLTADPFGVHTYPLIQKHWLDLKSGSSLRHSVHANPTSYSSSTPQRYVTLSPLPFKTEYSLSKSSAIAKQRGTRSVQKFCTLVVARCCSVIPFESHNAASFLSGGSSPIECCLNCWALSLELPPKCSAVNKLCWTCVNVTN